jgi:DNA-binding NarL/FixJ family response regulator
MTVAAIAEGVAAHWGCLGWSLYAGLAVVCLGSALTCLRRLRQQGLATMVVLMSGHWDPEDAQEIKAAGADGYVIKTGLPALLAELIEQAR